MERESWIHLAYLVAAVLFILGLKGLTHPRTAVRGNWLGALGMLIAIVATLLAKEVLSFGLIFAGLLLGTVIGAVLAMKVRMTAMPQMVALLNGLGGGASVLVAGAEAVRFAWAAEATPGFAMPLMVAVATMASGLIGGVTFWGSLVAYGKLQEFRLFRKPIHFRGQQVLNGLLAIVVLTLAVWGILAPETVALYWALAAVASVLGVLLVAPIGGADMPVVIAVLNSYSGLAGRSHGVRARQLGADHLRVAGRGLGPDLVADYVPGDEPLVGPGDLRRSRSHGKTATADEVYGGKVKSATAEEIAILFDSAQQVVIVPGYGLAVAQAQHAVSDLMAELEKRGVEVLFAIHPVAGRMPGHMNVLLAEADVPYDKLKEMDEINPLFSQTDVALVIGANDVVNPLARTDPTSPIAGMPILDVDKARTVIVVKRSLSPGFAGIPNPLFAADNTLMFFGDGKEAVLELIGAMEEQ